MYLKHFPHFLKPLGKHLVFNIPNNQNEIYLTFDDGPHPEITPWVLKTLAEYDAKATFFVIGEHALQNPELIQNIRNEGHAIGNHSYSHPSGWKTPSSEYYDDIDRCQEMVNSKLFRPPYGQITRAQSMKLKDQYSLIMWSDLSADFDDRYTPEACFEFATKKVGSGSIIVFHDSEKAWPRLKIALAKCLEFYAQNGFNMRFIH